MANQAPDARDLKHWEDAFQYPLPVIRKLEQQLRAGVNDNREKVRALVGSGYRDLLGTADRIIDMNDEMQRLEDIINDIGRKCNSRVITKIATNHGKLTSEHVDKQATQRRISAEVALLQGCLSACRRILKSGSDQLLAARLLLLGRLLQNSAAKTTEGARLLKAQRLKLGSLRGRLMSLIDKRLGDVNLSRTHMLDLLSAYSLITTSSLADVSRYFLRIRQQCIVEVSALNKRKGVVRSVDLLVATLEQVNSVFPRRMSEAMDRITGPHLLQDEPLRAALDFDLDIYERWISNDIRSFVPWLRNNDLTKDALNDSLQNWAQSACSTIVSGLQGLLHIQSSPLRINTLRENTIRHFLESNAVAAGFEKDELLMTMRGLFQERLFAVTTERAHTINAKISEVLSMDKKHNLTNGNSHDRHSNTLDLRRGASAFRKDIVARSQGKDATLEYLDAALTQWMKQTRWADELDLDDDADAPDDGGKYHSLLAEKDPSELTAHLTSETESALRASIDAILAAVDSVSSDASPGPKALFLLRVLRVIPLPADSSTTSALSTKAVSIRTTLHTALASSIISTLTASIPDLETTLFSGSPATNLWHAPQGQSPLPVLPSPGPFRLLTETSKAMLALGLDIWIPAAVVEVRTQIMARVVHAVEDLLSNKAAAIPAAVPAESSAPQDGAEVNGEEHTAAADEPEDGSHEVAGAKSGVPAVPEEDPGARFVQALFDAVYLRCVLVPQSSAQLNASSLEEVVSRLKTSSKVSDDEYERLVRNAGAYHRRSYLLFGVLAG
ncbi:hypothetical protein ANO11243_017280 [Dothideomycetidae sp. 11243]|nr:hypothetical protein ANO11243_017280 [fungal sp. No.11243]